MTLTITDCGDEWQYDQYTATLNNDSGFSVELTEAINEIPWSYAERVLVHLDEDQLTADYYGWVSCPTTRFEADEEATMTVVVSEVPLV